MESVKLFRPMRQVAPVDLVRAEANLQVEAMPLKLV
jgi:hypothetical protein